MLQEKKNMSWQVNLTETLYFMNEETKRSSPPSKTLTKKMKTTIKNHSTTHTVIYKWFLGIQYKAAKSMQ